MYGEGNVYVDGLANIVLGSSDWIWWSYAPSCIKEEFFRNKFDLPNYLVCFAPFFLSHGFIPWSYPW